MNTLTTLLSVLTLMTSGPADDATVKAAVEKGLKRIEIGAANYPKHRQCFSCHHQAMSVISTTSAKQHGFTVDDDLLKTQIEFSLKTFRNKGQIARGQGVGGDSTSVVYILQTLAAACYPRDETTDALVEYLLVRQEKDGSWPIPGFGDRPPTMEQSLHHRRAGDVCFETLRPTRGCRGRS